jgi:predicted phage replisome organizer
MADVKWIKVTTDLFDDEKILLIESLPEADSIIVIWFKILCLAGKQNNNGVFMMSNSIPYTDSMLATIFRRKESTVQLALKTFQQFGMIEVIEDVITIPNWEKHQNIEGMEKLKAQNRERVAKYREKQKQLSSNVTGNVTVMECNGTDKIREEEKRKEESRGYSPRKPKNSNIFLEMLKEAEGNE